MTPKHKTAQHLRSGWLLEVGVIGIDKTLKLLRLTQWTLLELEQVLRPWCRQGVDGSDKAKLPWLKIPHSPWEGKDGIDFGYYEDEANQLFADLEQDEEAKLKKGRGPTSQRQPLTRWMLDAKTLNLFRPGSLDNDTERKKLEAIRAHSLALGAALKEIAGKGRVTTKHYPDKIAEIIKHSKALPFKRRETLEARIARADALLKEHDAKRKFLIAQCELFRERWKKVGKLHR
jgi:hypothetical protein